MKKKMLTLGWLAVILMLSACSHTYYKTREGKAKQKYYNDIQFGADSHPKKKF